MYSTLKKSSTSKKVYSVADINKLIRTHIHKESTFQNIWIEGELLNVTKHPSGHIYFSLKDAKSQIRCTFFKQNNSKYKNFPLKGGTQVLLFGSISVYVIRGEYQLNVQQLTLAGEGALRLQIEELKKRLDAEGLFAPEQKKKIPMMYSHLGIVTSPTGAVVRDIMRVALGRYPNLNITLASCLVQGGSAPDSIVTALKLLQNKERNVDLIIIGRGGGSFEDLLAFNDEKVLRAIANCTIPIVSAVGHEIDNTLSDLVADDFAPTPSAASEKFVPDINLWKEDIEDQEVRLIVNLRRVHEDSNARYLRVMASQIYKEPSCILEDHWQRLDLCQRQLQEMMIKKIKNLSQSYEEKILVLPLLYEKKLFSLRAKYELLYERLQNFSPLGTLKRGYSLVCNDKNKVISSIQDIQEKEKVNVMLHDGSFSAEVKKIDG